MFVRILRNKLVNLRYEFFVSEKAWKSNGVIVRSFPKVCQTLQTLTSHYIRYSELFSGPTGTLGKPLNFISSNTVAMDSCRELLEKTEFYSLRILLCGTYNKIDAR